MDENALIRETQRADEASRILENEAFKVSVATIKDRIWKRFLGAPVESLPALQLELKVLEEITECLKYMVDTGKMSQVQLNSLHDLERGKMVA